MPAKGPESCGGRASARRALAAVGVVGWALATGAAHADERIAARMADTQLTCEALDAGRPDACAAALLRLLRTRAEQQYIAEHALQARPDEIAAVRAYEVAFERHDRSQRERKRSELEARLAQAGAVMSAAERARLVEFQAVLARLADYESDVDAGLAEAPPPLPDATIASWVEQAKLDRALYRRYGGIVAVRPVGLRAHGARAALLADYIAREAITLADPQVAQHFRALLHAPPAIVFEGTEPDFTPFWLRPLAPSYMGSRAARALPA
jgi:hypothetical protein